MANKVVLKYGFVDSMSESMSKTISSVKAAVTDAEARTLGQAFVTNKDIFGKMPAVLTSIEKVATTTTEITLA